MQNTDNCLQISFTYKELLILFFVIGITISNLEKYLVILIKYDWKLISLKILKLQKA